MKKCIDYLMIARAIEFYTKCGFEYIDAEWAVTQDIMDITLPSFSNGVKADFVGPLLGSGEQYFLQEIKEKRLKPGKYCCATPCFRDDQEDDIHGAYFFKVELIDTKYLDLYSTISAAQDFFMSEGIETNAVRVESDHIQYDVCADDNIELGSYGIRGNDMIGSWCYGTGVAEPRTSIVKRKLYGPTNG